MSRSERRSMVVRGHPSLSLSRQCRLLSIGRSSLYYKAKGESAETSPIMKWMVSGVIDPAGGSASAASITRPIWSHVSRCGLGRVCCRGPRIFLAGTSCRASSACSQMAKFRRSSSRRFAESAVDACDDHSTIRPERIDRSPHASASGFIGGEFQFDR